MDLSLKKQTSRKVSFARALALTAVVSLTVLLSGCTGQPTKIENTNKALFSEPVVDQKLANMDFAFPSQPPSLMKGREIFQQQCVKCHAQASWQSQKVKEDLAFTTPIDMYSMLTEGGAPEVVMPTPERKKLLPAHHPAFRDTINHGADQGTERRYAGDQGRQCLPVPAGGGALDGVRPRPALSAHGGQEPRLPDHLGARRAHPRARERMGRLRLAPARSGRARPTGGRAPAGAPEPQPRSGHRPAQDHLAQRGQGGAGRGKESTMASPIAWDHR